ncbi:MAG: hypothetical protein IPO80_07590 [Propionibacteriaceae bacterium]|nr:hypothetical protein [Propionibacteriaceae bacterium]
MDAFDVIVIEGFGYGYSDLDVPDRTVENITGEIHQVLGRLGVHHPVILIGHSDRRHLHPLLRERLPR